MTDATTTKKEPRFIPGPGAGKPLNAAVREQARSPPEGMDTASTNDGRNVFIVGLNTTTKEEDLRSTCEDYGSVLSCDIMRDPHTGESRSFAFVTMKHKSEADGLIAALDGSKLDGKKLTCRLSRRGGPRKETPGVYLGLRREHHSSLHLGYYRGRGVNPGPYSASYDYPPPPYYDRYGLAASRDYPYYRSPPPPYGGDPYRRPYDDYPPPRADDYPPPRAPYATSYSPRESTQQQPQPYLDHTTTAPYSGLLQHYQQK